MQPAWGRCRRSIWAHLIWACGWNTNDTAQILTWFVRLGSRFARRSRQGNDLFSGGSATKNDPELTRTPNPGARHDIADQEQTSDIHSRTVDPLQRLAAMARPVRELWLLGVGSGLAR